MNELSNTRQGTGISVDSVENELSTKGFIERMNQLAAIAGSANALARRAGISQGGIRRYFEGGEPTLSNLISLAAVSGVNLLWLATGVGPMRPTDADGRAPPDRPGSLVVDKLRAALTLVRDAVVAGNHDVTTAQEAEIATGVYELLTSGPPDLEIPRSVIDHMLRAVSAGTKK